MVKSFGRVTVTTAGTPVRATDNVPAANGGPTARQGVQSCQLQADPANTDVVYVFAQMSNPPSDQRASGVGLIAVLAAPASAMQGPFATVSFGMSNVPAGVNLNDLWLDAGADGQAAIVSALV